LAVVTGRIGGAVATGEALPPAAAPSGNTSWTSILKSKAGMVEAQLGETEISLVP
jgi:hypothetical protein